MNFAVINEIKKVRCKTVAHIAVPCEKSFERR